MSARRFLERVEQTGLVDDAVLAKLRAQVGSSGSRLTARALAEMLVKNGHLTKAQATRLLDQAGEADGARSASRTARPTDTARPEDHRKQAASGTDEELGLAPLDDDEEQDLTIADADEEVVMLEDASSDAPAEAGLTPLDESDLPEPLGGATPGPSAPPSGLQPVEEPPGLKPLGSGTPGLEPIDAAGGLEPVGAADGLEPVGAAGGLEPVGADAGLQPVDAAGGLEPIDAAGGLEPVDATAGLEPIGGPPQGPPGAIPRIRAPKNVWDSKLLLVGGGALIVLSLIVVGLYFLLHRGTATEMLEAANEDYRSEAYAQAIAKYEKFLKRFPKDPNVSLARVRIGTAKLWQALDVKDKRHALKAAGEVLPQIENEEKFSEARPELATILPEIAEGFASQAKAEQDIDRAQELVDLAEEAMELVNAPKYIPTSLRTPIQATINRILEDIELAKRNINRTKRLAQAVESIRNKAAQGQTAAAYEERRKLLNEYPELERAPSLVEAVLLITERERALVKVVQEPLKPSAEDHPSSTEFQVALASRKEKASAGNKNHVVFFLARGAIYALDAASGELLWRRFVGHETLSRPQPFSQQAGADVIAVDGRRNELLRLAGGTGKLVWRLPIGEPFVDPLIYGKRILVATRSGRILDVDAASGEAARHAVIPQQLGVAPGTSKLRHLYQVGDHSNLYVLDETTLECKEVYYLGHKPGSVVTRPVMVLGHLFVAVNSGEEYCDLHVLAVDENGLKIKPAMKPIRLKGRIVVMPLAAGARLTVVTDRGAIHVFEVNPANADEPVMNAVEPLVASFKNALIGYPVMDGGRLFVGNDRFTKYEVQTSQARLIRKWIKDERDVFVAPPVVLGDAVYHLRRRQHSPSYTAAAVRADDGQRLWEVDLATPATLLSVDMQKRQIHCITAEGELFEVTPETFQRGLLDQAATAAVGAARTAAFSEVVALDDGRWALTSPDDRKRVVIYDPSSVSRSGRLQARPLKAVGNAAVTAPPVSFAEGLLLALDNGQVLLVDPMTGANKILPFQAPMEGGAKVRWHRPAVVGGNAGEFVISDDRGRLYRIGIKDQPKPHLDPVAQAKVQVQIASPLAAARDTVYAVVRASASDTVVSFAASDLAAGTEWPLEGQVIWGPIQVGDVVLLASEQDGLLCFESGQKLRWKTPLSHGRPVGRPCVQDGDFILTSLEGTVWRASGKDGSEIAAADVGQPLGGTSVAFGSRLLLSSADGTLLVIPAIGRR